MNIAIVQVTALDGAILLLGKPGFICNIQGLAWKKELNCRYGRLDCWNAKASSVAAKSYQSIRLGHHIVGGSSGWCLPALSFRRGRGYTDDGTDLGAIVDHRLVGPDAEHQSNFAH